MLAQQGAQDRGEFQVDLGVDLALGDCVSAMTRSAALPSTLFTTFVAPNERATSSRLSSKSTITISAGE
jgi:hypothetical protein